MNVPGTSKGDVSDIPFGFLRQVAVEKVAGPKSRWGLCMVLHECSCISWDYAVCHTGHMCCCDQCRRRVFLQAGGC